MKFIDYARAELQRAGHFDKDADYGGAAAKAVLELVRVFAGQHHSGGSAGLVLFLFERLARFKPLSPLTSDPDEWMDVSETCGRPLWQSRRDPEFFSEDGGRTWHSVNHRKGGAA